jgi:hypothetical protein
MLFIQAQTREEAIEKAYGPISLPNGEYVDDSFQVDEEVVRPCPPTEGSAP